MMFAMKDCNASSRLSAIQSRCTHGRKLVSAFVQHDQATIFLGSLRNLMANSIGSASIRGLPYQCGRQILDMVGRTQAAERELEDSKLTHFYARMILKTDYQIDG